MLFEQHFGIDTLTYLHFIAKLILILTSTFADVSFL